MSKALTTPRAEAKPKGEQENAAEFQLLLDANPLPAWIFDRETLQFLAVNDVALRHYGYGRDEFLAMTIKDIRPPEELAALQERLANLPLEPPQPHRWRHRKKDSSFIEVDIVWQELFWHQRRAVLAIIKDVTEEQRQERARREQAELLDLAHVLILNPADEIIFWNRGVEQLYGWTKAEALGADSHDLLKTEFPQPLAEIKACLLRDGAWEGELIHCTRAGAQIVVASHWTLQRDRQGRPAAILEVNNDITVRKRAEEALRAKEEQLERITDITPHILTQCSRDHRYIFVNRACAEMLGLTPEQIMGQPIPEIMGQEAYQRILPYVERVLAGQHVDYEEEIPYKDIGPRFVRVAYRPDHDEQGQVRGWIASIIDITEHKQAEEERERLLDAERRAREAADTASRAKDEFLAIVSHELRSPLNAILGWSRILRSSRPNDAEVQKTAATIERNGKMQLQLIEDLLDTARIISGKLKLEVGPVELVSVISAALDVVRPAAEAKGITLSPALDPDAGQITGDADRLQQVVWNLLSNAVKFTAEGGRVTIELKRDGPRVAIVVSDTGQGIAPDYLPCVFDRFSQAEGSSSRRRGGLGLGLALVKHLTELHGGSVAVESAGEGQGASFTVRLPMRAVRSESDSREREAQPNLAATLPGVTLRLDGTRVLAVDDEADARELIAATLGSYGAQVEAVASGAEAIQMLARHWDSAPFDVLVCDIGMPEEDGYTVLGKVRQLPADVGGRIPAIALTAYARAEDRLRALQAGYQMHLTKPVEPEELVIVLGSLVGRVGKGMGL